MMAEEDLEQQTTLYSQTAIEESVDSSGASLERDRSEYTFTWEHVWYRIRVPNPQNKIPNNRISNASSVSPPKHIQKDILKDISGYAEPGKVLA